MRSPIELHFYNKNNEVVKTYSQDRVTWEFFKKAVEIGDASKLGEDGLDVICRFVCDFFGNKFSVKKLKKHTDVEQVTAVAGQVVVRVLTIMQEQGIEPPKEADVKKKTVLKRMTGFLRSKRSS